MIVYPYIASGNHVGAASWEEWGALGMDGYLEWFSHPDLLADPKKPAISSLEVQEVFTFPSDSSHGNDLSVILKVEEVWEVCQPTSQPRSHSPRPHVATPK